MTLRRLLTISSAVAALGALAAIPPSAGAESCQVQKVNGLVLHGVLGVPGQLWYGYQVSPGEVSTKVPGESPWVGELGREGPFTENGRTYYIWSGSEDFTTLDIYKDGETFQTLHVLHASTTWKNRRYEGRLLEPNEFVKGGLEGLPAGIYDGLVGDIERYGSGRQYEGEPAPIHECSSWNISDAVNPFTNVPPAEVR
jgi:hypothetical protein